MVDTESSKQGKIDVQYDLRPKKSLKELQRGVHGQFPDFQHKFSQEC